jgi:hypothetical protein
MCRQFLFCLVNLSIAIFSSAVGAQQDTVATPVTKDTETRPAGARYQAGGLHKFFFGAHYRDLWTTPVEVPIIDLSSFAGGLTPIKKGGGKQTKSLRFQAGNGRLYAFRSITKDPSKILPPELQETIASNILQDQISSAHPYAALVVAPLAEAVGVLHPKPQLVILPNDERLGQFREEFARLLGFIEEYPEEGPDGEMGFAGSDKVIGTYDLFEELEEDNDNAVEAREFLKARLLDIFVGDWDRHVDQWRWARFKKDKKKVWYPIPRDRDQAFAKFDGLFPAIAEKRYIVPQFEGFNKGKPDIVSLTYSGRHLDRRLLNGLSYDDFQTMATELIAKLTDPVIENAVRQLPAPIYAISGEALTKKLKTRRNEIKDFADNYYKQLAKYAEIKTSNQAEYVEVSRRDDEHVVVEIFKRNKETGEKTEERLYQRTFKRNETKEIRLFLLGGNDKAAVNGSVDQSILVRIIGGGGQDEIVDHSKVNGSFLGLVPFIADAERKTFLYDVENETQFMPGPSSVVRAGKIDSVVNFYENEPRLRDYGYANRPFPFLAINADDGLFMGAGMSLYHYSFRKVPYGYKMSLRGNFAFKTSAFRIRYTGHFVDMIKGVHFSLEAGASVPRMVRNFYGLGNDTKRDADLERDDFYRVRSKEYMIKPTLHFGIAPRTQFSVGSAFKHFDTVFNDDSTFAQREKPYGIDIPSLLELNAGFTTDWRDRLIATTKGLYLDAGISHFPRVFDNDSSFTKGYIDGRFYFTPMREVTFAFRAIGQKVWGTFPYYEAAYLGGRESLRGFRRDRFAGDEAVNGSAEVRLFPVRLNLFFFKTDVGLFFFGDAGRVWLEGESRDGWHTTSGAGICFAPIYRTFTFSIGAGNSSEGTRITAGGGFTF